MFSTDLIPQTPRLSSDSGSPRPSDFPRRKSVSGPSNQVLEYLMSLRKLATSHDSLMERVANLEVKNNLALKTKL